jgi:hypothetical protein
MGGPLQTQILWWSWSKRSKILNNVMGAKIWWRWLTHPTDLWAKLWRHKYAPNIEENNLIRLTNPNPGSSIWNTAWGNHHLVQEHAFWEVHNGQTTLFWTDSWKQLPPLHLKESMQGILQHMQHKTHLQSITSGRLTQIILIGENGNLIL